MKPMKSQSLPKNHHRLLLNGNDRKQQSNKRTNQPRNNQIQHKKAQAEKNHLVKDRLSKAVERKRSSSSFAHIQRDVEFVKNKMQELTNQKHFNHFLLLYQQQKNQNLTVSITAVNRELLRLKEHLVCFQFLALKCFSVLQSNLKEGADRGYYTIDKQKADSILHILKETANYMHANTNNTSLGQVNQVTQQAQSTIVYLNQQHTKSVRQLGNKEKILQSLQKERENIAKVDECYQEIKTIVHQFIEQVTSLWEQLGNKDTVIDSLVNDNQSLRQDLKSMQELVKRNNEFYYNLGDEMHINNEKIRMFELSLLNKDEQIAQLQQQIQSSNRELQAKCEEIQLKSQEIKIVEKELDQALTRQKEFKGLKDKYQLRVSQLQEKNEQLQKVIHKSLNGKGNILTPQTSEYDRLREESNQLKKQIVQNFKKIELYQQKLIQLISLANKSNLKIQEEGPIAHLIQQLQHQHQQSTYKTLLEDNPQTLSPLREIHFSDLFGTKECQYQPYKESQREQANRPEQTHEEAQPSQLQMNRHYSIHVMDEKQHTIDSYQT